MQIILASGSPRRRELLSQIGIDFKVIVSDVDETIEDGTLPQDAVKMLSLKKAEAVYVEQKDKSLPIIAADTVVVLGEKILGKPVDEEDAEKMLADLSGKVHKVMTGVTIIKNHERISFVTESDVKFYTLTQEDIQKYIKTGEPMDKAGAYGIQGRGAVLVEWIHGDYFNIVGLPIAQVAKIINS